MFCSCLAKRALNAIYKHYSDVLTGFALYISNIITIKLENTTLVYITYLQLSMKLIFYGKLRVCLFYI